MHIGAFLGINMWLFSVGYFNYTGVINSVSLRGTVRNSTRNDKRLYEINYFLSQRRFFTLADVRIPIMLNYLKSQQIQIIKTKCTIKETYTAYLSHNCL